MLLLTLTTLAVEQPQCTVGGLFSDCFATGCCADPTLACYKRLAPSKNHAECRPRQTTCINSEEWLCPGWEHCSERGEACMSSRCCKDSSHQCYQKNEHFAQCLPKGECLGLKDADTNVPWLCSVLREPAFCSDNWAECTSSKCCNDPAYTCYEKNAGFSKCMRTCPDPGSSETFTCALHDREQRDKAAFIATLPKSTTCSGKHEECTVGGCCADEGFHCYDKGPHFAMCLREIECATFWSDHPDCKIREIPKDCSAAGHDCSKNHCCTDLAYTCFQKDAVSHVARCMRGCSSTGPGRLEGWECNRLTASPPVAAARSPPPAPSYRASRGNTCNSFAGKNSLGDAMCSGLSDMFVCESSYRVSAELSATVPGATVMEPCVWFGARSRCANGEPIECTPPHPPPLPASSPPPATLPPPPSPSPPPPSSSSPPSPSPPPPPPPPPSSSSSSSSPSPSPPHEPYAPAASSSFSSGISSSTIIIIAANGVVLLLLGALGMWCRMVHMAKARKAYASRPTCVFTQGSTNTTMLTETRVVPASVASTSTVPVVTAESMLYPAVPGSFFPTSTVPVVTAEAV